VVCFQPKRDHVARSHLNALSTCQAFRLSRVGGEVLAYLLDQHGHLVADLGGRR
jgi:hypothetical protein